MGSPTWTKRETDIFLRHFHSETLEGLADRLGVSIYRVTCMQRAFGLWKHAAPGAQIMPGRAWTSKDLTTLASLYLKLPTREIAVLLNRTQAAVRTQARALLNHPDKPRKGKRTLGALTLTRSGVWIEKIGGDDHPPNYWRPQHLNLWEKHNGPIPRGAVIVFKDGNKSNVSLENLELFTKNEWGYLRAHMSDPPHIRDLGLAVFKLRMAIQEREREEQD
jgi:hypothetical protein